MCGALPTVTSLLDPTSHLEEGRLVIRRNEKLGLAGQTNP